MENRLKRGLTALGLCSLLLCIACSSKDRANAPSVSPEDSLAFMQSRGVNTLISDSGVLRYKIVAETWDIHNSTQPATWKFMKGLLLTRFDEKMQVDLYVQADTAYLHQQYLWELRGRVHIKNIQGTRFRTEELFWDMQRHQIWSNQFMRITTPTRELQGTTFRSNEQMTDYLITNSAGAFPAEDTSTPPDTTTQQREQRKQ